MAREGLRPASGPNGVAGLVLVGALVVGGGLRLWVAFTDGGMYWPDEVHKSLEQAHRVVYGYGLVPWEYVEGASSWVLPGLLAGLLGAARLVGLDAPDQYLAVVRLVLVAVGLGAAWGAALLARALGAPPLAAACAAAVVALAAPTVYFSPRALTESTSTLPLVLGLALVLERDASGRKVGVGAALLGLSAILRLQNGVLVAVVLVLLVAWGRRQAARTAVVVLAAAAALFGLLEWATWGRPFHSVLEYVEFNLIDGRADFFGTEPFGYYLGFLWHSAGPPLALAVLAGLVAALADRRARPLVLAAAAYVLLHSLVPHKEGRFLVPLLPVLGALAAVGLAEVVRRVPARWAVAAPVGLVAAAAVSAIGVPSLTWADLAQTNYAADERAYDLNAGANRLLVEAGGRDDLCGLLVAEPLAFVGGYTWLHRDVPLYEWLGDDDPDWDRTNYVIARAGRVPPWRVVAESSGYALVRRDGPCTGTEGFNHRLPGGPPPG